MAGFLKKTLDPLGLTINDDMGMTFVTSGTNAVGYRVAKGLLGAGYKHVRVGIWKGTRQPSDLVCGSSGNHDIGQQVAMELEKLGATVITFDWTKEDDFQMALAGVKSVFCTIPHMNESSTTFEKFIKACRSGGVEHFVKTSFYSIQDKHTTNEAASNSVKDDPYEEVVPYVKFHHRCDNEVTDTMFKNSRMTYTLLRTSHLMSNILIYQGPTLRKENKYVSASYGMGVNYISPNDVAKAGMTCLVNRKEHRNKVYNLTGTGYIRDVTIAKLLSKFYESDIEHKAIGYHEMEDELKNRGLPSWLVLDLCNLEKVKASGIEEKTVAYTKELEPLIGNKPENISSYLSNTENMTLQENPTKEDNDNKKGRSPQ